ncbi:MAG: hypothetical protein SF051_00010 [Elusimicrobiota bacterium]|nr:hypothetical protein [Elusimicrobiota bacterium]
MSDAAPGRFDAFKQPLVLKALAAVIAAAGLAAAGHYALNLKPEYDALMLRGRTTQDLFALYDLQVAYHKRYGTYADDFEALVRTAPDGGAALRARLQAHAHLDTLAVAGDAEKFRLEANVRDPERTLIVVKGPRVGDPLPPRR